MRIWDQAKFVDSVAVAIILSVIANPSPAQRPAKPNRFDPPKILLIDTADYQIRAGDSELQRLLKSRLRAAITEWKLEFEQIRGRGRLDDGVDVGRRILEARLSLASSPAEELTIRQQYVTYSRESEKLNRARFDAGGLEQQDFERSKYFRIDAEIQVLRLGASLPEDKTPAPAAPAQPSPVANSDPPPERSLTEFVKVTPLAIDPAEPLLRRLLKERANSATTEVRLRNEHNFVGRGTFESLFDSGHRARDSRLQLASTPVERLEVLTQYRDFTRPIFELNLGRWEAGGLREYDLAKTRYERLSAEFAYLRATASAQDLTTLRVAALPDVFPEPMPELEGTDFQEPDFIKAKGYSINANEPALQRLPKECVNCGLSEGRLRFHEFRVGRGTLAVLFDSGKRTRDARLQLTNADAQIRDVLSQYLGFTQAIETLNQARFEQGSLKQQDLERSRYERLSAEIDLLRAKAK